FTPNEHVELLDNVVKYAIPGADVVETNVVLQQMVGSELTSRRSARARHPWVDDDDLETSMIDEERMEMLMMQSISMQVQQGMIPPVFLAFREEERRKEPYGDIFTAFKKADDRMRQLQATPVEPDPDTGLPPAEAQPGAAGPAQQPVLESLPASIGPTPDQEGLRELMNAIAAKNRAPGGIQR